MELVSTLCFGTHSPPEPPLIAMLINTVFKEREETEMETQELSPYRETKSYFLDILVYLQFPVYISKTI